MGTMTVPVRRATPRHAAVLGDLLFAFNTEFDAPTPQARVLARRFARLLGRGDVFALISGDPEATGFALVTLRPTPYFEGPLAQLEELYVVPHLRDHGIGTALLQAALREVKEARAGEMHINVDEVDVDARRFYERHGFLNIEPGTDYRMLCYLREL
jgi:GNAT superfamily N-acetyltransferase